MVDLSSYLVPEPNNPNKRVSATFWNNHINAIQSGINGAGSAQQQYRGFLDLTYFGVKADSTLTGATGSSGAANLQGFKDAMDFAMEQCASNGLYHPGVTILLPPGVIYLPEELNLRGQIRWLGHSTGHPGLPATMLRFDQGSAGIIINSHITEGYGSFPDALSNPRPFGTGTMLDGIGLFSGDYNAQWGGGAAYSDTAEADGILLRVRATVQNCWVRGFQRDNMAILAGSSGTLPGNANCFKVRDSAFQAAGRHGLYITGDDANAGSTQNCYFDYNRRWGLLDESFLGNSHRDHHAEGNAIGDGVSAIDGIVSYPAGGQRYAVMFGQEVAAATTTPGTNENVWRTVGGATGGRTWASGIQVRSGGAYAIRNGAGHAKLDECYSEAGQGPIQNGVNALVLGGSHGPEILGGVSTYALQGNLAITRPIKQTHAGALASGESYFGDPNTADGTYFRKFRNSKMTAGAYFSEKVTGQDFYSLETETDWLWRINGRVPVDLTATRAGRTSAVPHMWRARNLAITSSEDANESRLVYYAAAIPTTGEHARGEVLFNIDAADGQPAGWMCLASGTPGTWGKFGTLTTVVVYSELVTNGNMSSSSGWTLLNGAAITGGKLNMSTASDALAQQDLGAVTSGFQYQAIIQVDTLGDSGAQFTAGDASVGTYKVQALTAGTNTISYTATTSAGSHTMRIRNTGTGTTQPVISSVSVKRTA